VSERALIDDRGFRISISLDGYAGPNHSLNDPLGVGGASVRGRCFIGTYVRDVTALASIGSYGPANITANIFGDEEEAPQQHALQGLIFGSL
jgi:hypothetical protein